MDMIVKNESLTSVADAIRQKSETTEQLVFPDGFAKAIMAIQSGGVHPRLIVTAPEGSTITCTQSGEDPVTGVVGSSGSVTLDMPAFGEWTVTGTLGEDEAYELVVLVQETSVDLSYKGVPEFTYSGGDESYDVIDDGDGDWRIKFYSSGVLTISKLVGARGGVDVFAVGGGGSGANTDSYAGGGGAGYTTTAKNVAISANTEYEVIVGEGGAGQEGFYVDGLPGGESSFTVGEMVICSAGGGSGGTQNGGDGGSGGGAFEKTGGSDGSDGVSLNNDSSGGKGQGLTTREFGEETGELYAGGGSGRSNSTSITIPGGAGGGGAGGYKSRTEANNGSDGKGGGGGAMYNTQGGDGGSGIVIIRNAR